MKDVKINLYFPDKTPLNKKDLLEIIVSEIGDDEEIGYAGFVEKTQLREHLDIFLGDNIELYRPLSEKEKQQLKNTIESTIEKSSNFLNIPPISIFVFPWLVEPEGFVELMGGINGFAPYKKTIHLYLTPEQFYPKNIEKTVAHEFNHTNFFNNHGLHKMDILETLIFEGLAENFEEKISGERNVIAKAIDKKESKKILFQIYPYLNFEEDDFYKSLFFDGKEYKRWTGYTIGYELVNAFMNKYSTISWEKIMEIEPREIFYKSPFAKKEEV